MALIKGITGTVTIGGTDYHVSSATAKIEQEKIEYVACGTDPAWPTQVPGGVKKLTGSIEFGFEDTTLPAPLSDSLVAIIFTVGTKTLTFNAAVYDIDIKKSAKGLVTITANYESSGAVTYG